MLINTHNRIEEFSLALASICPLGLKLTVTPLCMTLQNRQVPLSGIPEPPVWHHCHPCQQLTAPEQVIAQTRPK